MLNRMFDKVKLLLFLLAEWCTRICCSWGLRIMVSLVYQNIKPYVATEYPNSASGP